MFPAVGDMPLERSNLGRTEESVTVAARSDTERPTLSESGDVEGRLQQRSKRQTTSYINSIDAQIIAVTLGIKGKN